MQNEDNFAVIVSRFRLIRHLGILEVELAVLRFDVDNGLVLVLGNPVEL